MQISGCSAQQGNCSKYLAIPLAEVESFTLDSSLLVKTFKADLAAKCTHPDHLRSVFTCTDDAMPMLQQLFIMLITHSRLFCIDCFCEVGCES